MADKLHFDLVTPERRVFAGEVDMVSVPGSEGDFGVLPNHAPVMSTIRSGAIAVHDGSNVTRTFIHGGFAEVTPDGLTILAEEALVLSTIDPAEIEQALTDAREDLADATDDDHRLPAQALVEKYEALLACLSH